MGFFRQTEGGSHEPPSSLLTSLFSHPYNMASAAATAGAEQTLVMRTVTAAAAKNDKRNDDDPNGAVVEQITQTIHSIASFL